jgi:hypothetical protein
MTKGRDPSRLVVLCWLAKNLIEFGEILLSHTFGALGISCATI